MTEDNKRRNVRLAVDKADRDLDFARRNLELEAYEVTVSLSYYCALHHARALLLSKGLQARTHSGVGRMLGLHFVAEGRLAPEHGRTLSYMQVDREDADYDVAAVFTKAMAQEALRRAEAFREAARGLLIGVGYL